MFAQTGRYLAEMFQVAFAIVAFALIILVFVVLAEGYGLLFTVILCLTLLLLPTLIKLQKSKEEAKRFQEEAKRFQEIDYVFQNPRIPLKPQKPDTVPKKRDYGLLESEVMGILDSAMYEGNKVEVPSNHLVRTDPNQKKISDFFPEDE